MYTKSCGCTEISISLCHNAITLILDKRDSLTNRFIGVAGSVVVKKKKKKKVYYIIGGHIFRDHAAKTNV